MDWTVPLENKVPAILDLLNRKLPIEINGSALFLRNFGPRARLQWLSRLRMMSGLKRSAAACKACESETAKKALSSLRKVTPSRRSSRSMKWCPLIQRVIENGKNEPTDMDIGPRTSSRM